MSLNGKVTLLLTMPGSFIIESFGKWTVSYMLVLSRVEKKDEFIIRTCSWEIEYLWGVIIRREGIIIILYIVTMYRLLDDDDRWTNIIFRTVWFTTSLSFPLSVVVHTTASSTFTSNSPASKQRQTLLSKFAKYLFWLLPLPLDSSIRCYVVQ